MTHRVNVMIDDDNWNRLRDVPSGERSRYVNTALQLLRRNERRARASADLDALRGELPDVGGRTDDWIRQDRDTHAG